MTDHEVSLVFDGSGTSFRVSEYFGRGIKSLRLLISISLSVIVSLCLCPDFFYSWTCLYLQFIAFSIDENTFRVRLFMEKQILQSVVAVAEYTILEFDVFNFLALAHWSENRQFRPRFCQGFI
jgi:hypothetical protein